MRVCSEFSAPAWPVTKAAGSRGNREGWDLVWAWGAAPVARGSWTGTTPHSPTVQPHFLPGFRGGWGWGDSQPSLHSIRDSWAQGSPGTKQPGAHRFRRWGGAWDTEASRNQRGPGSRPRAPPSPGPQCPEGLACTLCPAHLASTFSLCAQVSPLPRPGPLPALRPLSRCDCVCEGALGGLRA